MREFKSSRGGGMIWRDRDEDKKLIEGTLPQRHYQRR
jgi:hypothetical protein